MINHENSFMTCHDSVLRSDPEPAAQRAEVFVRWVDPSNDAMNAEGAARILGLLEEVGLTGPKLAACSDDVEGLTKQLVERLGLPQEVWQIEFVRHQVSSAVQMEDLERRLEGSAATPSSQRLMDAMAAEDERRSAAAASSRSEESRVVIPRRGTLGKSVRLRSGRIVPEEEAEEMILATGSGATEV